MYNIHHTIPISLEGEDIKENKIQLWEHEHGELHNTQNIPYKLLRKYREKVNGILIPTNYSFNAKQELWNIYFENAQIKTEEQKNSLLKQTKRYGSINKECVEHSNTFEGLIGELIRQQKIYAYNILKYQKNIY